jgi:flagellar M-ring protein FliF
VRAITHLVASSVEGLTPDRVTVVDTRGVLLSAGQEEAAGLSAAQLSAREQIEAVIEQRLQSMLDRVLGPGRSIVRVSAEVDFSRRQVQEESLVPNSRAPKAEVSIEESYEGQGPRPGGPAGATPGVPSYTTAPGGGASQYRRRETRTTYEVVKRVEHAVSGGGGIRRLSVAVLVDGKVPAGTLASLKSAIAAGVGFDPARRDSVVVQAAEFPRSAPQAPEPATPDRRQPPLLIGGAVLALILVIVLGLVALRMRRPKVQTLQPRSLPQSPSAAAAAPPADEEERILAALRQQRQEQPEAVVLRREVQRLAEERPADAAAIVKSWLSER